MIRRLYVDNFRSLMDFTWQPGGETLVLGYNGSGKTSVFDAFEAIRIWIQGGELPGSFKVKDFNRLSKHQIFGFEIEIQALDEEFKYRVWLGRSTDGGLMCYEEQLSSSKGGMFLIKVGDLSYKDTDKGETKKLSISPRQSGVEFLNTTPGAGFAQRFFAALSTIINIRPMPTRTQRDAERPEERPSRAFENFVAWYWHYSSNGAYQKAMLGLLENVWPEFDHLKIERLGREAWGLGAVFKGPEKTTGELSLDFDELSDGERMLVMLYALAAYQKSQPATTIIIDEPDNFVSLLELQPWLRTLLDARPENGQIILVSHNPEIIQMMGAEKVAWFSRADHLSPTRVSTLPPDESGLSLPERLARGWIDA